MLTGGHLSVGRRRLNRPVFSQCCVAAARDNVEVVAAAVVRGWAAACFQHHGQQQTAKHSSVVLLMPGFPPPLCLSRRGQVLEALAPPAGALRKCNINTYATANTVVVSLLLLVAVEVVVARDKIFLFNVYISFIPFTCSVFPDWIFPSFVCPVTLDVFVQSRA